MFDHHKFSKDMKLALVDYIGGVHVDENLGLAHIENLQKYNLGNLVNDSEKIAFWVNVYNGLTNHFIIHNQLQTSVRELTNFFTEQWVNIGDYSFSLDDIEHGILRKNRERNFNRFPQFSAADSRHIFAPKIFEPRIHFALNCGGLSCPPVVSYAALHLNDQLTLAEQSFASQEFIVDHAKRIITCSSIFVWYRNDFDRTYLNNPSLEDYQIQTQEYNWDFK